MHKNSLTHKRNIFFRKKSLHTIILKDFNNNIEKLIQDIQEKIKVLSCRGEESS